LVTMLRILLLQQCFALSEPAMEVILIEVPTMRRFAGIEQLSDRFPDETMILLFRQLFEKHELGEHIFEGVKGHHNARGITMRKGTIVDATFIAVPSSSKNTKGKCDSELPQTEKCNQWYHGLKVHSGLDKDSCFIHSVVVSAASVHYLNKAAEIPHAVEEVVYGVAGY